MTVDPLIGTELGDFRPLRRLGKGGMGVVYEAEDLSLPRHVALKVLRPEVADEPLARSRFQREIEHAVQIEHPHVTPVYTAGYEPPHFYIAMRLVRGPDLAAELREHGALPEQRALRLLGQLASALHAVHEHGLVHRDVKPANVLLWGAGTDDEHAMLTDFGIAKALNESRGLTGMGAIGTPAYMAPEVCLGQSATPASDQYSLACLAFELLAGELPYDAEDVSFADAHISAAPKSLAALAPALSPATVAAVHRALAKKPANRHAGVRELVRAARPADEAFQQSEAVTRVMRSASRPEDAVTRLIASATELSDERISEITGVDRTQVLRVRRRAARDALVGRRRG